MSTNSEEKPASLKGCFLLFVVLFGSMFAAYGLFWLCQKYLGA